MGRRGPKPVPTAVLRLVGSREATGRRRGPSPLPALPSPPTWLSPEARREWGRILPELAKLGLLCRLDRALLTGYCESWACYVDAVRQAATDGLIATTPNGFAQKSAAAIALTDARSALLKFAAEFGLSPSSRVRLVSAPKAQPDDPLGAFAGQKREVDRG